MGRVRTALGFAWRVALVLVVIEGVASWLHVGGLLAFGASRPLAERAHTRYDEELGWVGRPNLSLPDFYAPGASLHTDSRGFRGRREVAPAVPPGRARVVCSGDSFTLGYGVGDGETWCRQLERLDPRLETVNLGQGGYGIDQSWLWWRRAAADLEHDAHVFAFIVEDFARMESDRFFGYGKPRLALRDGELAVENVPVPRAPYVFPWLTRNLALAGQLRSVALVRGLLGAGGDPAPASRSLDRSPALALAVFEDLARRHRAAGRELVLVYLPMQSEHAGDETAAFRDWLADQCAARGLRFVDLVEDLRRVPDDDVAPLFIAEGAIDFPAAAGHYTAAGNRRVAEWLYARVGGALLRPLRAREAAP